MIEEADAKSAPRIFPFQFCRQKVVGQKNIDGSVLESFVDSRIKDQSLERLIFQMYPGVRSESGNCPASWQNSRSLASLPS
jgi:hypothetical protein